MLVRHFSADLRRRRFAAGAHRDRLAWRRSAGQFLIAVLGLFTAGLCRAQSSQQPPAPSWNLRLSLRPREAATATWTERAGLLSFQSRSGAACAAAISCWVGVYVPKQCVGRRRCPLLLYSNLRARELGGDLTEPLADKHGILVAQIGGVALGLTDSAKVMAQRVAWFDEDLKTLLQSVAVDPDRIAILGGSATGTPTIAYGVQNMDVFSRVLVFTQHVTHPPPKTPALTNEYYVSGGLLEDAVAVPRPLWESGYPTTYRLEFREHGAEYEDYDAMGRWLEESWTIADPARRTVPDTVAEVLLTPEALTRVAAFWDRFAQEPDSIRTLGRRATVREVVLPFGRERRVWTLMADMAALAARCPSVAAAFQAAGLTPGQYEAYRAAFAAAHVGALPNSSSARTLFSATSTVAQNIAFLQAHPAETKALWAKADLWSTP